MALRQSPRKDSLSQVTGVMLLFLVLFIVTGGLSSAAYKLHSERHEKLSERPGKLSQVSEVRAVSVALGAHGSSEASQAFPSERSPASVKVAAFVESLCPDSARFFVDTLSADKFPAALWSIADFNFVVWGNVMVHEDGSFSCQHGPMECRLNRVFECALHSANAHDAARASKSPVIALGAAEAALNDVARWGHFWNFKGPPSGALNASDMEQRFSRITKALPHIFLGSSGEPSGASPSDSSRGVRVGRSEVELDHHHPPSLAVSFMTCIYKALLDLRPPREQMPAFASLCAASVGLDYGWVMGCAAGSEGQALETAAREATEALRPAHTWVPWVTVEGQPINGQDLEDMSRLPHSVCDAYAGKKPEACDKYAA